jgi:hypothetical protein
LDEERKDRNRIKILVDYRQREIRLTEERLAHILEHPEMRGLELALEETLGTPERVFRSRSDEDALLFYWYLPESVVGGKWLCVVVKESIVDAFVLTAYLTDKPKKGEQLWPNE